MATPRRHQRYERHTSAGGVVFRREGDDIAVLLCGRRDPPLWCLPKGTPDAGEAVRDTALREVREETGWRCRLKKRIGKAQYRFQHEGRRVFKTVHWFLMDPVAREGEPDPVEILDARWRSLAEAKDLLVYDSDKAIMAKLKKA